MKKVIDLSLTLRNGMRGVELETKNTIADKGWNAKMLHLYSHSGTHLDAPIHFDATPTSVVDIPLERCMGPAWVARIPVIAPKALIGVKDLGGIADKFQTGDSLLIQTGWSHRLGYPEYYRALPRISPELAEWCVAKRMNMLGVEMPAVADPLNIAEITAIHNILLGAEIIIVEGLTNLEALKSEQVIFMALPLKIEGGDGSPVRAIAIEEVEA